MAVGVAAEIKSKLNVVDVVGETVQLKKAGTTYKGLCPFHGEKTPSFTVTPARESWKCFGCGVGGDVFSFVMKRDGADRSRRRSRSWPRRPASRSTSGRSARTPVGPASATSWRRAIAFYHAVLTGSKLGQPALDYLRGRGFTDETIATFQLGWAPGRLGHDGRTLAEQAPDRSRGARRGRASPSRASRARGGVFDRFRERVIFPIRDENGAPVGLGGRILGQRRQARTAATAGRSTSTRRPRRCSTRAGRCT